MSALGEVFLGVIAAATLAMAIVLTGLLVAAGRLIQRLSRLSEQLEADIKPVLDHLNAIGREASKAAALTSAQVERVDRLFADVALRVDESVKSALTALSAPAKDGRALLMGIGAFLRAFKGVRARRRGSEDEDALFI